MPVIAKHRVNCARPVYKESKTQRVLQYSFINTARM